MILRYPDDIMAKYGEAIFGHTRQKRIEKFVQYVINSKYRKVVGLRPWLEEQVISALSEPAEALTQMCNAIPSSSNYDSQMISILKHCRNGAGNLTYVRDRDNWSMSEYWQTSYETAVMGEADCEDGSILMYVLARMKGVPANRMILFAGNVQSSPTAEMGGHCWLAYKPKNYPLNYVFLDWCYHSNLIPIRMRHKFCVFDKEIVEYLPTGEEIDSRYKSIWFGFSELVSFTKVTK